MNHGNNRIIGNGNSIHKGKGNTVIGHGNLIG